MSSNTIFPFTIEHDRSSKKVRKTSGDLDDSKKALITTTDTVVKEGNLDRVDKKGKTEKMLWRNPSLLLFQQKIILTQSTKQINNKYPIKQQIKNIKTDTVKSLYKSRFTQRTDKENTVDK